MSARVGSVLALWRFPVKSMGGETLAEADLDAHGVPGDRAFGILDVASGKVVGAKIHARILECAAAYVESPRADRALPPIRITLPGGGTVTSDAPGVDRMLSDCLGAEVRLVRPGPGSEPKDQTAFLERVGLPPRPPARAYYDLFPVSLITTSTLVAFGEAAPDSRFDLRRFRMNVIVETGAPGYLENDWVGKEIALGAAARLLVALPDPRCVLTTFGQGELARDPEILKTMVRHNSLKLKDAGPQPCAGVYTEVSGRGVVKIGDAVDV